MIHRLIGINQPYEKDHQSVMMYIFRKHLAFGLLSQFFVGEYVRSHPYSLALVSTLSTFKGQNQYERCCPLSLEPLQLPSSLFGQLSQSVTLWKTLKDLQTVVKWLVTSCSRSSTARSANNLWNRFLDGIFGIAMGKRANMTKTSTNPSGHRQKLLIINLAPVDRRRILRPSLAKFQCRRLLGFLLVLVVHGFCGLIIVIDLSWFARTLIPCLNIKCR